MCFELWVVDVARVAEQRHPHDLRGAVAVLRRPEGDLRVVVLDVELPGDALLLEPVEDGRQLAPALGGHGVALPLDPGGARDPVHVVDDAAAVRRREEPVEQHVLVGDVPVVRTPCRCSSPSTSSRGASSRPKAQTNPSMRPFRYCAKCVSSLCARSTTARSPSQTASRTPCPPARRVAGHARSRWDPSAPG